MLNSDKSPVFGRGTAGDRIRRRKVLAVLTLALMTVVSAVSGLNMALPSLAEETGATQRELQWIVDAYTMTFAGLLLLAGAIGDRYGRKFTLLGGIVVFGASATAAMFATSPTELIAFRAVMGVGAAFIMPITLSIITTTFPPDERPKAVGLWVGMSGAGAVIGLFVAGALLEVASWNSFFGLNVVLSVVAFIGTVAFVSRHDDDQTAKLDVLGGIIACAGVTLLVFGLIEVVERGWNDAIVIGAFIGAMVSAVAFVLIEWRVEHPLLDPRLFRERKFAAGALAITAQFFAMFGFFFVVTQYLQFVVGFSPLRTALAILPLPIIAIPLARNTPMLAERLGLRRTAPVGLIFTAIALIILTNVETTISFGLFVLGLAFVGFGMALATTPSTTAIVQTLPAEKQGVASAVNDVSRELGSALGIAVMGSLLNAAYRDEVRATLGKLPNVSSGMVDRVADSIAVVRHAPTEQIGQQRDVLLRIASDAFVGAIHHAFIVTAAVMVVVAAVTYFLAPRSTSKSDETTNDSR